MFLHFLVPVILVRSCFVRRFDKEYFKALGLMLLTMVVDIDHLLATPVYEPLRCSMGFHPLHTFIPVAGYFLLLGFSRTRLIGAGLIVHMLLDSLDCMSMPGGMHSLSEFLPGL